MSSKATGEIKQLQQKLNSSDLDLKQEAIRKIIDAMTRGKDVSPLFMDVLKNMENSSLNLKKLIYLYIINYAKLHPHLAILGVNSFRKDAVDKNNPFLRALAVRTMGCIRIKQITQYLCDPLKKALKDEDPYVRKTAALCVPKLYEIAPEMIEQQGFIKLLESLLNDGNATVLSNAVASLAICSDIKGAQIVEITDQLVQKLLTAMNDCNEWGVVYIIDTITKYVPKNQKDAEGIMERINTKLAHTNSAVALSAIRLIFKYLDYLDNPEAIRLYINKISVPLITLISRESQISYIALKTINIILQKRPLPLPKELKVFFVNYHDPLYVKLEKLQILTKIANNDNILMILHELKEAVQEVDTEYVRKAVRTIGRCAIKLEKMADKCVQCLWEALKSKSSCVIQETLIAIRDIFRKYPNKYEGLLSDICQHLNSFEDSQAKASIVWIIGEYAEMIENADELISNFAETFKDEPDVVQQQILLSCVKLYLHKPQEGQQILKDIFTYLTKQCENPDLRDRGFIYWRLLSINPKVAKQLVLKQRPPISDQSQTYEPQVLERLIENIGNLSSVYGKIPQEFVKRLKQTANSQEVMDQDPEELLAKNNKTEQQPQQKSNTIITFTNNNQMLVDNSPSIQNNTVSPSNLIDISNLHEEPNKNKPKITKTQQKEKERVFATQAPNKNLNEQIFTTTLNKKQQINKEVNKIVIPLFEVVSCDVTSLQGKYNGLSIKAAFQKQSNSTFLQLVLQNSSNVTFSSFAIKLNANAFCLAAVESQLKTLQALNPSESQQVIIPLNQSNKYKQLQGFPYTIDCALCMLDDVFVFKIPCCLSIGFAPSPSISFQEYKSIASDNSLVKKQQSLSNTLGVAQFIQKLKNNDLCLIFRKTNNGNELMSFACQLVDKQRLIVDIIFDLSSKLVNIQMTGPNQQMLIYFNHSLAMITNL